MARYSGRHRFTGVNIGTGGTLVATVPCLGAVGFIVKIFGGSNAANNLASLAASPSHDGASLANGGIDTTGVGVAGLTNGSEALALSVYIPSNPAGAGLITPWPTEYAQLFAAVLTAVSNGCTVDVWVVYDDSDQNASRLPT